VRSFLRNSALSYARNFKVVGNLSWAPFPAFTCSRIVQPDATLACGGSQGRLLSQVALPVVRLRLPVQSGAQRLTSNPHFLELQTPGLEKNENPSKKFTAVLYL